MTLFTRGYNKQLYVREVQKLLKISSRTALVTLMKLEKKGILRSETKGKIRLYTIRKAMISREYFFLAEQYKKICFFDKNQLIKEVLEKADDSFTGIVMVFGSYAKGIQKKDSDLDMFIVGKFDEKKIREIGKLFGIDINIKSYPKKIFIKVLHEDILLKEV